MKLLKKWPLAAFLCVALSGSVQAQQAPVATIEDYGKWQNLGFSQMSPNGQWISWTVSQFENNDTLWVKKLPSGEAKPYAFGGAPSYSADNQWLAFRIGVSFAEREKLTEQKKPVINSLGLLKLATGELETIKGVSSYSFSEDGKWLSITMQKAPENRAPGNTILLRNLATGQTRTLGSVTDGKFNKPGNKFAYAASAEPMHSVEIIDLASSVTTVVASDTTKFSKITWDRNGQGFAFLSEWKDEGYEEETQKVHFYHALAARPSLKTFNPVGNLPEGNRIFEGASIKVSDDLARVHFGTKEWTKKPEQDTTKGKRPAAKKEKPVYVDVWNWDDKEIQPRQKVSYNQDRNRNLEAVWHTGSGKGVILADEARNAVNTSIYHTTAVAWDADKYKPAFREDRADFYLLDLETGAKQLLLEHQLMGSGGMPSPSPTGRYLTYFKDLNFYVYDTKNGTHTNVTEGFEHPVFNVRDDRPSIKGPAGMAGWLKGDQAFLIYDEYDVWRIQPDGKNPKRLTDGREQQIIYRVQRLNFDDPFIDPAQPIYLSRNGDHDIQRGFARLDAKGNLSTLVYEHAALGSLQKAKDAEFFSYTYQRADVSPVLKAGAKLDEAAVVYESNKQVDHFAKTKTELIYFTTTEGKELKGVLTYPVNYEEGKQYPMIVYIYEILSNTLHNYTTPSRFNAYNFAHYTNQGYFVFRPDIVYETDEPGVSSVRAVVPAVEEVLKTGKVRRDGIAMMGHSWGGYQTTFLVTQTDLFSAAIAGAPLTNMMSMSLAIYWNSGTPNQKIFETGQGRFSGPWYETEEAHWRNSPIIYADKINTPMLMTFGDKDGAVDWHQGIEMYGTMRRMGKPFTLLVYADENHSLAKREHRIDYFDKVTGYLDHYLKGVEAPKWLSEGVSYVDKMKAIDERK